MTNSLSQEELVARVRIPLLPDDTRFGFSEVSRRAGDFAMAAALALFRVSDGRIVDPRIGICGVEPHPRRVPAAEAALTGKAPGPEAFLQAAAACSEAVDPMDDEQTPASYRRELVLAVVRRALDSANK